MENILHCLNAQDFPRQDFEIILVEDKGGSEKGRSLVEKFNAMNIVHFAPHQGWGKMGFMRNYGLSKSKGEIILFLDDDTVIMDNHFLSKLYASFNISSGTAPDGVMPLGQASWALIKGKYDYHDPYFFSNRCMAYKKTCLMALNGFNADFIGQEDVELAIRFVHHGFNAQKSKTLVYFHPPLVYADSSKGYAVGASFASSRYSLPFKFLLMLNGSRWIFRFFLPGLKNKYMARFGLGFLAGFISKVLKQNRELAYK